MRHLMEYNEHRPDPVEVARWRRVVEDEYGGKVGEFDGQKYVVVDEKMNFLTGNFMNKGRLVHRICNEITFAHEHAPPHTPSLRRAVKDWVDSHAR